MNERIFASRTSVKNLRKFLLKYFQDIDVSGMLSLRENYLDNKKIEANFFGRRLSGLCLAIETPYAEWLLPGKFHEQLGDDPQFIEIMRQAFRGSEGKPFIDLGAGMCSYGYQIARNLNASCYVGVEPYFNPSLLLSIVIEREKNLKAQIPYAVVSEHMLKFLKRFTDNSLNATLFACAIDNAVLNEGYAYDVKDQIKRILSPNGSYIFCEPAGMSVSPVMGDVRQHSSYYGFEGSSVPWLKYEDFSGETSRGYDFRLIRFTKPGEKANGI
ncbi:hypothetical protein HYW76_01205 [Candidatus Pacearchaeota archaeon]|nr:hypothetical protein [Candidatus Pacearchaeota archaeon]